MKKRMFIALVLVVVLTLFLLVSGCGSRQGADDSYDEAPGAPGYDWDRGETAPPKEGMENDYVSEEQMGSGAYGQRYAIKTGEISVDVEDIKDSEAKIRSFVEGKGGFIASSNFYSDPQGDYQSSSLMVRVPQQHFDATMLFLEEEVGKKTYSNTGENDVTLQYVDMEARISNLTRQEERYTEILEKAETVEEILQIERELVRIRGDIESLTAQFIHLRDRVSLATITISLRRTVTATPGVTAIGFEGAWERAKIALTESLNTLINGAASFFVFSFRALPYAILVLAGFFALYKVLKRFDRKSTPKSQ